MAVISTILLIFFLLYRASKTRKKEIVSTEYGYDHYNKKFVNVKSK